MSKQTTDSKNPAWGGATEQPVAEKGKTGNPGSEGQATDVVNPLDGQTGLKGGTYKPTKTSY